MRIGLGGVATVPWRAHRAEAALRGQVLTEEAAQAAAEAEFSPASIRHDNRYKRSLGPATLVRAVLALQAMEAVTMTETLAAPVMPKGFGGRPEPRQEARSKVTGQPLYAADFPVENLAYGYLVMSSIARGRMRCHKAGRGPGRRRGCWTS